MLDLCIDLAHILAMKLRYVLLIAAAAGAFASIFLAGNMYAQMREIERGVDAAFSRSELVRFDTVHALGFLTLSFLFLALFLLLLAALRDPQFVSRVENEPIASVPRQAVTIAAPPSIESSVSEAQLKPVDVTPAPTSSECAPASQNNPVSQSAAENSEQA